MEDNNGLEDRTTASISVDTSAESCNLESRHVELISKRSSVVSRLFNTRPSLTSSLSGDKPASVGSNDQNPGNSHGVCCDYRGYFDWITTLRGREILSLLLKVTLMLTTFTVVNSIFLIYHHS